MEENNQVNEYQVVEQPEVQSSWETPESENTEATQVEIVAEANNIEASISVSEPEVTAITSSDLASSTVESQALGSVANGVIGVTSVSTPSEKPSNSKPIAEKVAVFSTKNITVPGLGKVYRGYNIVTKDAASQWTTKSYIRLATPEEVAKEFGK